MERKIAFCSITKTFHRICHIITNVVQLQFEAFEDVHDLVSVVLLRDLTLVNYNGLESEMSWRFNII